MDSYTLSFSYPVVSSSPHPSNQALPASHASHFPHGTAPGAVPIWICSICSMHRQPVPRGPPRSATDPHRAGPHAAHTAARWVAQTFIMTATSPTCSALGNVSECGSVGGREGCVQYQTRAELYSPYGVPSALMYTEMKLWPVN